MICCRKYWILMLRFPVNTNSTIFYCLHFNIYMKILNLLWKIGNPSPPFPLYDCEIILPISQLQNEYTTILSREFVCYRNSSNLGTNVYFFEFLFDKIYSILRGTWFLLTKNFCIMTMDYAIFLFINIYDFQKKAKFTLILEPNLWLKSKFFFQELKFGNFFKG